MTYPKLSGGALEAAIAYAARITEASFSNEASPLSVKAEKIQQFIQTGAFGCNTEAVAKLVSMMLEEEIAPASAPKLLQGALVTATDFVSQAKKGRTYIVAGAKGKDIRLSDALGSNCPTVNTKFLRKATDDEIRAFVTERHGGAPQLLPDFLDDERPF